MVNEVLGDARRDIGGAVCRKAEASGIMVASMVDSCRGDGEKFLVRHGLKCWREALPGLLSTFTIVEAVWLFFSRAI